MIEGVNHKTFIILMSSAEAFSKEVMEVFAFHHLYKPLDLKNTINTIDRMKNILSSYTGSISLPAGGIHEKAGMPTPQIFVIHMEDNMSFIKVSEIVLITRNGRKTEIHTDKKVFNVSSEIAEELDSAIGRFTTN